MKLALLTLALVFLTGISPMANAMEDNKVMEKPHATAVLFFSESCGACKILDPKVTEAMASMDDATKEKIHFVKLDFTNKQTIANTRELAVNEGVNDILQEYGAKTGFVVLLNNEGQEVDKLKADDSTADIAAKLTKVIASAS